MRLIVEARLVDGESDPVEEGDGVLTVIDRSDLSLAELGLILAEGRSLLAKVQCSGKCYRWTRASRRAASGIGCLTLGNSSTLIESLTSRTCLRLFQTNSFANAVMSRP